MLTLSNVVNRHVRYRNMLAYSTMYSCTDCNDGYADNVIMAKHM